MKEKTAAAEVTLKGGWKATLTVDEYGRLTIAVENEYRTDIVDTIPEDIGSGENGEPYISRFTTHCIEKAQEIRETMSDQEIIAARATGITFYTLCDDQTGECPGAYSLGILTTIAKKAQWEHGQSAEMAFRTQRAYSKPFNGNDAQRVNLALFQHICSDKFKRSWPFND